MDEWIPTDWVTYPREGDGVQTTSWLPSLFFISNPTNSVENLIFLIGFLGIENVLHLPFLRRWFVDGSSFLEFPSIDGRRTQKSIFRSLLFDKVLLHLIVQRHSP